MRWIGAIIFLLLLNISAKAQERALEPSSATDASVKMETLVLCVINDDENSDLCPVSRSRVALSSRATRSAGSPERCWKGMMISLDSGSKAIAALPSTQPAIVMAKDNQKARI